MSKSTESRSPEWPKVRKAFLAKHSVCGVCGKNKKLEAHHIIPFHIDRRKELDPKNLYPLCEGNKDINCHLMFGHFGDFENKYNKSIRIDAPKWQKRFTAKKEPQ